jgi:hypothetical protein
VLKQTFVPHGIGMSKRQYCVPAILAPRPSRRHVR